MFKIILNIKRKIALVYKPKKIFWNTQIYINLKYTHEYCNVISLYTQTMYNVIERLNSMYTGISKIKFNKDDTILHILLYIVKFWFFTSGCLLTHGMKNI